jgi:diacylglycerol kinase (ATP)
MERLLRAAINTWHGLLAAARSEEAFRQELIALVVAVPVAFLVAEQTWKRLALIAVVAFVLVVELLNTAIEKLADRVNLAIDPQIGRVKDMGSAAVGLALLIAVVAFVLVVELLNTAIEKLADRVNLAIDPQIGRVKDMGSAAVGLALLIAGMAWLLALAERLGLI